jgi:hypothetical protein
LYQHWSLPDCKNHWEVETDSFRVEIRKLTKSKNFYNYLLKLLDEVYNDAAGQAKKESGLNFFPQTCPYTLDVEYLPPFTYL